MTFSKRLLARWALVATVLCGLQACEEPPAAQAVGLTFSSYVDAQRTRWDSNGPRPLETTFWYPAAPGAPVEDWHIAFLRGGPSAFAAPLPDSPRKYPLVLLSHGTGGSAITLSWLARALAQAGYIVAAVNHHGNTAAEPKYLPQGFSLWWERARDLSVLLDKIATHPQLGPRVDMNRVGVAGFSLGGYTALMLAGARTDRERWVRHCEQHRADSNCKLPAEASFSMEEVARTLASDERARASLAHAGDSYRDKRVRAAFVIAPVLASALDPASVARISIPVSLVVGQDDEQAPPKDNAAWVAQQMGGARLREISNGTHYMFITECLPLGKVVARSICTDPWGVDRRDVHRDTAALAVEFFNASLAPQP